MTAKQDNGIVARLRRSDGFTVDRSVAGYPSIHPDFNLLLEAAIEIERLRAVLKHIEALADPLGPSPGDLIRHIGWTAWKSRQ